MTEERIGLVKKVECKLVKTDPALIEAIALKIGYPVEHVRFMMRYNIFTINQFAALSKMSVSHVLNKTRPSVIGEIIWTELDYCYPFHDYLNEGPKFILRNEKSEKFLKA
jgi:hypothetical protein